VCTDTRLKWFAFVIIVGAAIGMTSDVRGCIDSQENWERERMAEGGSVTFMCNSSWASLVKCLYFVLSQPGEGLEACREKQLASP